MSDRTITVPDGFHAILVSEQVVALSRNWRAFGCEGRIVGDGLIVDLETRYPQPPLTFIIAARLARAKWIMRDHGLTPRDCRTITPDNGIRGSSFREHDRFIIDPVLDAESAKRILCALAPCHPPAHVVDTLRHHAA